MCPCPNTRQGTRQSVRLEHDALLPVVPRPDSDGAGTGLRRMPRMRQARPCTDRAPSGGDRCVRRRQDDPLLAIGPGASRRGGGLRHRLAHRRLRHAGRRRCSQLGRHPFRVAVGGRGLASGGLPTVLLGPLAPFHFEQLPKAGWIASMHFFLLDCSDVVRRERLEARPPWRGRDRERAIAEQAQWGVWLREHIGQGVDTSQAAVEETVGSVAGWVRSVISTPVRWRDDATLAAAVEAAALSDRRLDSRLPQRRGPERAHGPRAAAPAAMVDRAGRSARGGAQPDCGARAWHAVPPSSRGLGAPVGGYRAEPEARLGCPSRHR
jgi:hypothetical protein